MLKLASTLRLLSMAWSSVFNFEAGRCIARRGIRRRTKIAIYNSHESDDTWPYRDFPLGLQAIEIDGLLLKLPHTPAIVVEEGSPVARQLVQRPSSEAI